MRMASVRPERRPAVKVTVGEGVDAVNPVYESYHPPRISRYHSKLTNLIAIFGTIPV
jgi:hypothetical protein